MVNDISVMQLKTNKDVRLKKPAEQSPAGPGLPETKLPNLFVPNEFDEIGLAILFPIPILPADCDLPAKQEVRDLRVGCDARKSAKRIWMVERRGDLWRYIQVAGNVRAGAQRRSRNKARANSVCMASCGISQLLWSSNAYPRPTSYLAVDSDIMSI
ncbi:hypothetical protein [Phenylobacterium sp.]|uniref:hypothetical protein n=1 Tax=Phenylobacterium sp. TaxID=1871053 RepID=UPI002735221E|nr:hypothetical protein [Phenylobacterium sp.]MDP3635557.1 hypothetical protein [Phenylobacterium sp.]MDZ4055001.1 hypothetical protein [Phenylobacterium sp.]